MLPRANAAFAAAILDDLKAGQSSPEFLAERLRIPRDAVDAICADMVTDGILETATVAKTITVFRLAPLSTAH